MTTWTSLRRPLTKVGRSGRSISRQVRIASSTGPALAAEERAGDAAGGVHPLLDVDGQREEVELLLRAACRPWWPTAAWCRRRGGRRRSRRPAGPAGRSRRGCSRVPNAAVVDDRGAVMTSPRSFGSVSWWVRTCSSPSHRLVPAAILDAAGRCRLRPGDRSSIEALGSSSRSPLRARGPLPRTGVARRGASGGGAGVSCGGCRTRKGSGPDVPDVPRRRASGAGRAAR